MHALAGGKALLAALPPEELDRYFAETERERFTPSTLTTEKALRRELAEVRRLGYSLTDEEYFLGIRGIGRVVMIDGEVAGSLSFGIPMARFDEALLHRAADLLERTTGLLESS
jgi:IclR family acetate operon transcriptional repressor